MLVTKSNLVTPAGFSRQNNLIWVRTRSLSHRTPQLWTNRRRSAIKPLALPYFGHQRQNNVLTSLELCQFESPQVVLVSYPPFFDNKKSTNEAKKHVNYKLKGEFDWINWRWDKLKEILKSERKRDEKEITQRELRVDKEDTATLHNTHTTTHSRSWRI